MTVSKRDGESSPHFLKQNNNRNKIVTTEILIVIGVVTVLFAVMLPNFMRAQSTHQVATVSKTVDSIADMLASTPGAFAEIDRGYASFPLYNQNGGYALTTVSSSIRKMVPMPDGEIRYVGDYLFRQVNIDEFARQYPEVSTPEFDGDINFALLLYPEFFAVIGWFGEFSLMNTNTTNMMMPNLVLDEDKFIKPQFELPAFDLSNGIQSQGAMIRTSYDLGWRIQPPAFRNPNTNKNRLPIEWTDWTKCRDVQNATQ